MESTTPAKIPSFFVALEQRSRAEYRARLAEQERAARASEAERIRRLAALNIDVIHWLAGRFGCEPEDLAPFATLTITHAPTCDTVTRVDLEFPEHNKIACEIWLCPQKRVFDDTADGPMYVIKPTGENTWIATGSHAGGSLGTALRQASDDWDRAGSFDRKDPDHE